MRTTQDKENSSGQIRCCNCQQVLFHKSDVLPSGISPKTQLKQACPMIFIKQQVWMHKQINKQHGELLCFNCNTRIGKFNLLQLKCTFCSDIESPGFLVSKTKVQGSLPKAVTSQMVRVRDNDTKNHRAQISSFNYNTAPHGRGSLLEDHYPDQKAENIRTKNAQA